MVSKEFIAALKLNSVPAYKIAQQAGLHPCTLSSLVCGISKTKPNDHRIIAVGEILGLTPDQCFEFSKQE